MIDYPWHFFKESIHFLMQFRCIFALSNCISFYNGIRGIPYQEIRFISLISLKFNSVADILFDFKVGMEITNCERKYQLGKLEILRTGIGKRAISKCPCTETEKMRALHIYKNQFPKRVAEFQFLWKRWDVKGQRKILRDQGSNVEAVGQELWVKGAIHRSDITYQGPGVEGDR